MFDLRVLGCVRFDLLAMTLNKQRLQRWVVQLIEIGKSADRHAVSMP